MNRSDLQHKLQWIKANLFDTDEIFIGKLWKMREKKTIWERKCGVGENNFLNGYENSAKKKKIWIKSAT